MHLIIWRTILGKILEKVRPRNDDDFIDRLSHRYTTIILLIFTAVVSTKQYVGDPIHCWCPAEYKSAPYYEYINQVCWVSNTYYIPMDTTIPVNDHLRHEKELTYYQWVPFILLVMAVLFKLPRIFWKVLLTSASFNLHKFVTMVDEIQLAPTEEQKSKLDELVNYIHDWRETSKQYRIDNYRSNKGLNVYRNTCFLCGKRNGNYFMVSVILIKVLNVVNASFHFFVLNNFLGSNFEVFGIEAINGLVNGKANSLQTMSRFPFVTLCDFNLRQMQNIHKWTIQCVLPINLFNEKIFLFIWFWLVMLCVLTSFSLIKSSYVMMLPCKRLQYIKKFLKLKHVPSSNAEERKILNRFVNSYLNFDGVYVLRMAGHYGTDILLSELIEKIYMKYKERYGRTKQPNGELLTVKYEDG